MNMKTPGLVLAMTLLGCSSGPPDGTETMLDAYAAAVAGMHTLTDGYVEDVAVAGDVDDVADLMSAYSDALSHELEELAHLVEDIESCSMGADGMEMADQAHDDVGAIQVLLDELGAEHATHTDVTQCQSSATAHESGLDSRFDTLAAHYDHWHDMDMRCESHEDDEDDDNAEHVD